MEEYSQKSYAVDALKERLIELSIRHVHGPQSITLNDTELVVLCLVKNGEAYIKEFIEHHQNIGVRHIVFLDNGSTDQTVTRARQYDNSTVLQTTHPFDRNNDMRMRQVLMDLYAMNTWSLTLDIDELWDYPYREYLSLNEFLEYLNDHDYDVVMTPLLDMYPRQITRPQVFVSSPQNAVFYELESIKRQEYHMYSGDVPHEVLQENMKRHMIYSGGVRNRVFGARVMLTKHALLKNTGFATRAKAGHLLKRGNLADISCPLYHYKLNDLLYDYARDAAEREHYFNKSEDYKRYHEVLAKKDTLILKTKLSRRLKSTEKLIAEGFISVSPSFCARVLKAAQKGGKKLINDTTISLQEGITVVMGTKNRSGERLKRALMSIRRQTYSQDKIHIIVVDYGSDKEHAQSIESLCLLFGATYVQVDTDLVWNRSHALNCGIRRVTTTYTLVSDVDIIFEENYIETALEHLNHDPYQVVYTTMHDLEKHAFSTKKGYATLKENAITRATRLKRPSYPYGMSIHVVRTHAYHQLQGYDETYEAWGCEDDDMMERFRRLGYTMKNMDDKTSMLHQWHPMYDGLTKDDKKHIRRNRQYLRAADTLLRNTHGWGRLQ